MSFVVTHKNTAAEMEMGVQLKPRGQGPSGVASSGTCSMQHFSEILFIQVCFPPTLQTPGTSEIASLVLDKRIFSVPNFSLISWLTFQIKHTAYLLKLRCQFGRSWTV